MNLYQMASSVEPPAQSAGVPGTVKFARNEWSSVVPGTIAIASKQLFGGVVMQTLKLYVPLVPFVGVVV